MRELKVSVEEPYLDTIHKFVKLVLNFEKKIPKSLMMPERYIGWDNNRSIRFTDNQNDSENSENIENSGNPAAQETTGDPEQEFFDSEISEPETDNNSEKKIHLEVENFSEKKIA